VKTKFSSLVFLNCHLSSLSTLRDLRALSPFLYLCSRLQPLSQSLCHRLSDLVYHMTCSVRVYLRCAKCCALYQSLSQADVYISVLTGCLTHLGPAGASWGQLVPAGASWYNTLKLASCHVHRPCPNPLQSPHRVMTSKQESSTSLASQFGKSVKC